MNSNTKEHAHDVSVRSKFMRVHSLLKLCARAHAHSLEGTLTRYYIFETRHGGDQDLLQQSKISKEIEIADF